MKHIWMEFKKEHAAKAYKERKKPGNDTQRSIKKQKTAWMDHCRYSPHANVNTMK